MALSNERKIARIDYQIAEWEESAYTAEIAHTVHTRLKSGAARLDEFVTLMTQAERAIKELHAMRDALLGGGE